MPTRQATRQGRAASQIVSLPDPGAGPEAACTVFRYHQRGEDDFSWGCVYRSAQTLLTALGHPAPELQRLADLMGRGPAVERFLQEADSSLRRSLWVEPHDVAAAFTEAFPSLRTSLELYCPELAADSVERTSSTTGRTASFKVVSEPASLRKRVRGHLDASNAPILIDNGTYAFAIAGVRGEGEQLEYRILDPHYGMLYAKRGGKRFKLGLEFPYGSDEGKDTWKPAEWIEKDFGRPKGGDEWMMLFATSASSS